MKNPIATGPREYAARLKASNWAVRVLPMLAPMITPTDWASVIMPPPIKPTTNKVVTVDELRMPVTKAPVSAPLKRLVVSFANTTFMV